MEEPHLVCECGHPIERYSGNKEEWAHLPDSFGQRYTYCANVNKKHTGVGVGPKDLETAGPKAHPALIDVEPKVMTELLAVLKSLENM